MRYFITLKGGPEREVSKTEYMSAEFLAGFYEVKQDGRVEYRSLPSNTSLDKLIEFFEKEGRY
jgi:hypothetical protein